MARRKTAQQRAQEILEVLTRLSEEGKPLAAGAEDVETILCETQVDIWEWAAHIADHAQLIGDEHGHSRLALDGAAGVFRVEARRVREGGPAGRREASKAHGPGDGPSSRLTTDKKK